MTDKNEEEEGNEFDSFIRNVAMGFPALPPKVAAAVTKVMGGVQKLGKDERNPFANYKYAGIEAFLEMMRPLCAEAGLLILQNEDNYEFRDAADSKGKVVTWLVITFSFGLAHSSGETWAGNVQRTAMVQASMGSQAFGAGQSYALKSFLRSIGLIATGDSEDADSHAQSDLPSQNSFKSAWQARIDKVYPSIQDALRAAETLKELQKVWTDAQDEIRSWPSQWKHLILEEKNRNKDRLDEELLGSSISELAEPEAE